MTEFIKEGNREYCIINKTEITKKDDCFIISQQNGIEKALEFLEKYCRRKLIPLKITEYSNKALEFLKANYELYEVKDECFEAKTLLQNIKSPVFLKGEKVVVDEITPRDSESFLRLSNDIANNKYWGYDCRSDAEYKPTSEYFLSFVENNKRLGEEYSLAIRYMGDFAGELVLHNFDFHCGVELGIRLLPEFQGLRLSRDALVCGIELAKSIGAKNIYIKCFAENLASYKMIVGAGFSKTHCDETFIYFKFKMGCK